MLQASASRNSETLRISERYTVRRVQRCTLRGNAGGCVEPLVYTLLATGDALPQHVR